MIFIFLFQGILNSSSESKTGKSTNPWYRPKITIRVIVLKNVTNEWDCEVHVVTNAKKVLKPPFITADPMLAKVWIALVFPFSPGVIINVWAIWAA